MYKRIPRKERRTRPKASRADAAAALRRDIEALGGEFDVPSKLHDLGWHFYRQRRDYVDQLAGVLKRHGHMGPPDVQLRNGDGRLLAKARDLFHFGSLNNHAGWPRAHNIAMWGVSLVLGGTRGFQLEGGPGRWRIVLGGPAANRASRSIGDMLNDPPQEQSTTPWCSP